MKNDVILYDGDCGFCSFWVQWLLNKDINNVLRFASLQGDFGQSFLKENNFNLNDFDTIYFINNKNVVYDKSTAILEILFSLGGIYKLLILLKIFPKFFRDWIYMLISKNRKRLAQNNCLFPTLEQRKQFID